MSIDEQIEVLLATSESGMTAGELASNLGIEKRIINSILYAESGKRYFKSGIGAPPVWKVQTHENSEYSEPVVPKIAHADHPEESGDSVNSEPPRACALCGRPTHLFFCSHRCRTRACRLEAQGIIRKPKIATFDEFMKFLFKNPTAQVDGFLSKCGCSQCSNLFNQEASLLQIWELLDRDLTKCVIFIREHFCSDELAEQKNVQTDVPLKVALASISTHHQKEIIELLNSQGLTADKHSALECKSLLNLDGISRAAQKNIAAVVSRRRLLDTLISKREIDQLTLSYVGISAELSQLLSIEQNFTLAGLERHGQIRLKNSSEAVKSEFDELLLALVVHPILPTHAVVENLMIWYPREFVDAQKSYLQRLRISMDLASPSVRSASFERVRRITVLLERLVIGGTLESLGRETGVTRERARQQLEQVFAQCGVRTLRELREVALEEANREKLRNSEFRARLVETVSHYIRLHPGILSKELEVAFPGEEEVIADASRRHAALVLEDVDHDVKREMTDRQDILEALREASLLSFPLTGIAYDQLVADGFVKGVSSMRIVQVYGSWREACRRADVEPGEPLKNVDYTKRYSVQEMVRVVGQFLLDDDLEGRAGGMHSYGPWRESQDFSDSLPSAGTIRNQIDPSWRAVKRLALLELRKSWAQTDVGAGEMGKHVE